MSAEDSFKNENVRKLIAYLEPEIEKALENNLFDLNNDQHVIIYTIAAVKSYLNTQMDGECIIKHLNMSVNFDVNHKIKIHLKPITPFGQIIVLDMQERFGRNIIIH